ncbi:MAG: hypothetical protein HQL69_19880 [Magnetococcales bacterium]|nr:hypothetical protein [Magnetococcales bacterium]
MAYLNNFQHADAVINHLDDIVPAIADPLLQVKYIGFVSVAAVTVYELAIKDIFIGFARKKHKVLGHFAESYFHKINGRIRLEHIKKDYIANFGVKYNKKFRINIEKRSNDYLQSHRRDIRNSYTNIIRWRHEFAHEGKINTTATYSEVVQAYEDGKEVIHSLADSMSR